MFLVESPQYPYGFDAENWNGFFNLTMTYRQDSDIFTPYGSVTQMKVLPDDLEVAVAEFGLSHAHMISSKEPRAAWFVSHCDTESQREHFVKELEKFYPVDKYGKCGNLSCSRNKEEDCWKMVESKYKYYLSFENSICTDYVTEKLFSALEVASHVMIPK